MSESFEPVYYVPEHGRVQRINSGSRIPIPASTTAGEAKKKEKNIYIVIPKDVEESMKNKMRRMSNVNFKQSNSNNSLNINDHKGYNSQNNNFAKAQARNTLNLRNWCDQSK